MYRTDTASPSLEAYDSLDATISIASVAVSAEELATRQSRLDKVNLIKTRLEARLPGRIRRLRVEANADGIILGGECSTYYTKQLAQHVAMAVMEYERLVNDIDVLPVQ